ncbi:LysR substrate-binding domain-containing protein [Aquipseudomonas ullengensis]|uniref:LysR family transcriptional regulator n=1 Tax=Aquipseudomonas ullengensis TaxID=2759166 RepID=A0A7W4LQH6_9GAMM|nr:LysR substrate-binding domain-containing protein [Pseudomonas ullengensis]MBB2497511.1 LysR family transcriptional regulator [Pseudomonas ullengensis]
MTRLDLPHVDLNLRVVFDLLMQERDLRRAAERLFLAPAQVSGALARLRRQYDDPLFVPAGPYLQPTPRALALTAIGQIAPFDPSISREVLRIGMSDDAELGLLPQLQRHLHAVAPHVVLVVRRTQHQTLARQLNAGEITVAIAYVGELPPGIRQRRLRRSRSLLLRGDGQGAPLSLVDYAARPHALVSGVGDLHGFIDDELRQRGLSREVRLVVPQFHGLAGLLRGSAMVASVPDYTAPALLAEGGVRVEELPFAAPRFDLSMAWSASREVELAPVQRWLREAISTCLGEVAEEGVEIA